MFIYRTRERNAPNRGETEMNRTKKQNTPITTSDKIANIARAKLGFETLETRKRDELDFREVSVWAIKEALEAAYQVGRDSK